MIKIVAKHFTRLSISQIISLGTPILTYPILFQNLGITKVGELVLAQSLCMYLSILIAYGFNISAVKEIAESNDIKTQSKKTSAVYSTKLFLTVISFIILGTICFLLKENIDQKLYLLSFSACLIELISPLWLLQAFNLTKEISKIQISQKFFYVLTVIFFIKSPSDIYIIPASNIFSIVYIIFLTKRILKNHFLFLKLASIKAIKEELVSSFALFKSNFASVSYMLANRIVIGYYFGNTTLGKYDFGDKLVSIVKIPIDIITKILLPIIAKNPTTISIKKLTFFGILFSITLSITTFMLAPQFLKYVSIDLTDNETKLILGILLLSIPIVTANTLIGKLDLLMKKNYKIFAKQSVNGMIAYTIITSILLILNIQNIYLFTFTIFITELTMLISILSNYNTWNVLKKIR